MRRLKGWPGRVGAAGLVVIAVDWGTQFWVSHALGLGRQLWIGGPVQIHYIQNGQQMATWTIWLRLVGVAALVGLSRREIPHFPWWVQVAGGTFLGGTLGNLLEVLVVGHVVDFIQIALPVLGEGSGNLADAGAWAGFAMAGGGGLAVALSHRLPLRMRRMWLRHVAAAVLAGLLLLAAFWWYAAVGNGHPPTPPPATPASANSAAAAPQKITAIASAPGSRTLAIRGGRVEWLTLDPTRWTPVALPTRTDPPLAGSMRPTAVSVTSLGVGLIGMSDGLVLAATFGADHAAAVVADYLWSPVVTLAGMGTMGHLQMLVSTMAGTYSVGLKEPLAVWWPHEEASAVLAPANNEGTWAAVVDGRLRWAPASVVGDLGASWNPGTWLRFWTANLTLVQVWRPGWWTSAWAPASSRTLGPGSLLAEYPTGGVAVATPGGTVLDGAPGAGLHVALHTVPLTFLGPRPVPTGLVSTTGNVVVLSSTHSPLLGWGSTWLVVGRVTTVHLLAGVGGNVLEVLNGGTLKVVAVDPLFAHLPTSSPVATWVGRALGLAILLVLLVLAGFATWRLPRRPRLAVVTAVGVILFGGGGVAVGHFVVPPAARYTWSQVHQAWLNGTYAASVGSWLLAPAQCAVLASAVGWHGPMPATVTTLGEPNYGQMPKEVVPTCALWAQQSPAQDHAAMKHPLSGRLNQDAITYYLQVDLGATAPAPTQAASQSACTHLGAACQAVGVNGRFPAYYSVRLVFPKKDYSLWQKVMGSST